MYPFIPSIPTLLELYDRLEEWRAGRSTRRRLASGMAGVKDVFGSVPLPDQVFAIEVLEQAAMARLDEGVNRVTVKRQGVTDALFTTSGKNELIKKTLGSRKKRDDAHIDDNEVHALLSGNGINSYTLKTKRLRWASGGVFSKVWWKDEWWTPMFFRDIPPIGWNLALGASEQPDNLNQLWGLILREFLEETLVVRLDPPGHRWFSFSPAKVGDAAKLFSRRHRNLRTANDGLSLETPYASIDAAIAATQTMLTVLDENGVAHDTPKVLVAINPFELGIEVVGVVEYKLGNDEIILDGEMYEPAGGIRQLVRMPVALISHRYLKRAAKTWNKITYTNDTPPSVTGPAFEQNEINLFDFDVRRRNELSTTGNEWEQIQYGEWMNTMGPCFVDAIEDPASLVGLPAIFTPSAAKISTYWMGRKSSGVAG